MVLSLSLLFFLGTSLTTVLAQENLAHPLKLEVAWDAHLKNSRRRVPTTIKTTSDNGVLITGYTEPLGKNVTKKRDSYLVRLDNAHNILWQKTIEMEGFGQISDFVLDIADGAILVGEAVAEGRFDTDAIVTRIDSKGKILWRKEFGDKWNDGVTSIISTADDGAIVAGYSLYNPPGSRMPENRGESQLYIARVDKDGNKIWDTNIDNVSVATSMTATSDGGAMIISAAQGLKKFYSLKIDAFGEVIWKKTHTQPEFESADDPFKGRLQFVNSSTVLTNPQGGFYVLADRRNDLILMKLDDNGDTIWRKTYSGHKEVFARETAQSMIMTKEGNLLILSTQEIKHTTKMELMKSDTFFYHMTHLFSLDSNGNKLWDKTYKHGKFANVGHADLSLSFDGGVYITRGMFIFPKENKPKMRWNIRLMKLMPK